MTQKYDLKALRNTLLKSKSDTPEEVEILGGKVFIRRFKAAELYRQEEEIKAAIADNDLDKISHINVKMILSCIVTPDGKPIDPSDLPTVDELLEAHDNPTLLDAIKKINDHSLGKLETATKN